MQTIRLTGSLSGLCALGVRATLRAVTLLFVTVSLWICGHTASFSQSNPLADANRLNQQAGELYRQGRLGEAEAPYKRSLAIFEKVRGPDHPDVATVLTNLGLLYASQGRFAEAEPLYKRGLTIREKALGPDHPDLANSLNNLATMYHRQGRYADAEPLLKRSLAARDKAMGSNHPDVAVALNNLAVLYVDQGRDADAEPLFKRSLAIREKSLGPDHPDVANGLVSLGGYYTKLGRFADAEPLLKRGLAIRERALGSDHFSVGEASSRMADLYTAQERFGDARPLYERNLAILEKSLGAEHPDFGRALLSLAQMYMSYFRYEEAEPLQRRGLAVMQKIYGEAHPVTAKSLHELAVIDTLRATLGSVERFEPAAVAMRRAIAIMSKRFTDDGQGKTPRGMIQDHVAMEWHVGGGIRAARETFETAQLAQLSGAGQAVARMAARFAAGDDAGAKAIRERQDLDERRRKLDSDLVSSVSAPSSQQAGEKERRAALRAEALAVSHELDALDVRIAKAFPRYADLSQAKTLRLDEAQGLLESDEALLVYLVADEISMISGCCTSWLWVLRRDDAWLHPIEMSGKKLAEEVRGLRSRLDPVLNPGFKPFDVSRAYALHQTILAPATPHLEGIRHVFVVPDGALESLPIGVLVTQRPDVDPEKPADHRSIAWFARAHAITVLPSVSSLRALRQFANTTRAEAPFVGFGNPVLQGRPGAARGVKLSSLFRGAVADVAAVRQLPPLPETADELRAVAKALGAGEKDLYLSGRASEPLLRNAKLDQYRVIEFATHGLMSGDLTGLAEPALVLTPPARAVPDNDGLVTASEVATLKLNADWVVLSACNTAAADGTPDGGGLSGLAKAFFYAGARSVLVSHWSVPSIATVKLVTGAFEALRKNPEIGRAEALRRAEMAMMDPANPPEFAHPLVWAPFVLAGEGGAGR